MEYADLAILAEKILEESGDEDERIADILDTIDPLVRNELLLSDFFNAYQVFYFFFRVRLEDIPREKLILTPASELEQGVTVEDVDLWQIIFMVRNGVPLVGVGDGEHLIVTFTGQESYHQARRYSEELL